MVSAIFMQHSKVFPLKKYDKMLKFFSIWKASGPNLLDAGKFHDTSACPQHIP